MSQENVEIARPAIDAFNRRDLDVADELTTPDFEWFPAMPGAVEGQRYAGREGIEANAAELAETWQDCFVVVEEYHEPVTGFLRSAGSGRAEPAAVFRSISLWRRSSSSATEGCPTLGPISITPRRCGRRA